MGHNVFDLLDAYLLDVCQFTAGRRDERDKPKARSESWTVWGRGRSRDRLSSDAGVLASVGNHRVSFPDQQQSGDNVERMGPEKRLDNRLSVRPVPDLALSDG